MKAGDIIFVRGDSLVSKVVRFFDSGEFSHVAIAVSETHVLEAQYFTKSRITPFYFEDYEIVDLGLSDIDRVKAVLIGVNLVGIWYDYIQIISYIFRNPINNPNNLICSEMVSALLYQLGKIENYGEVMDLTPNQLYDYLKGRDFHGK